MRPKNKIRFLMAPIQNDVGTSIAFWLELKTFEKWRELLNGLYDGLINEFVLLFPAIKDRREICGIRHKEPVVTDIMVMSNPGCLRSIMKMENATVIKEMTKCFSYRIALVCEFSDTGLLMTTSQ